MPAKGIGTVLTKVLLWCGLSQTTQLWYIASMKKPPLGVYDRFIIQSFFVHFKHLVQIYKTIEQHLSFPLYHCMFLARQILPYS